MRAFSLWLRTTGFALCYAVTACSSTQQQNFQGFLANASADAKIVACLDAAGAALAGPVLTATGNTAGTVVSAAGAATAQVACPPGTSPQIAPVLAGAPASTPAATPAPLAPATAASTQDDAVDVPPSCPGTYQAASPTEPNYNPACVQYLSTLPPAPQR